MNNNNDWFSRMFGIVNRCYKGKAVDEARIWFTALKAGYNAGSGCTPEPLVVVEHFNPLDDKSPIKRQYAPINDGVCGFAQVTVVSDNKATKDFIKALKSIEGNFCVPDRSDAHNRRDSFQLVGKCKKYTMWVHVFNQSMTRKAAFAKAFCDVVKKHGINAYSESWID